jgi:DNA-binding PadR family transcriptional regulator
MDSMQDLMKGTVVPVILQLLSEREMYGYEIIRVVNERTNGALAWREGTLYPWLHRLEGEGLITSQWVEAPTGRQRKYYAITRAGLATLKTRREEWAVFARSINAVLLTAPA